MFPDITSTELGTPFTYSPIIKQDSVSWHLIKGVILHYLTKSAKLRYFTGFNRNDNRQDFKYSRKLPPVLVRYRRHFSNTLSVSHRVRFATD